MREGGSGSMSKVQRNALIKSAPRERQPVFSPKIRHLLMIVYGVAFWVAVAIAAYCLFIGGKR